MRPNDAKKVGVKSGLPRLAWVLFGLLVASSVFFLLAREEKDANPSAESTLPSGTAIFANLLRKDGFDVSIDPYRRPVLPKNALAIVYDTGFAPTGSTSPFEASDDEAPIEVLPSGEIEKWIAAGGTALCINVDSEYDVASQKAIPTEVWAHPQEDMRKRALTLGSDFYQDFPFEGDERFDIWLTQSDQALVSLQTYGKGALIIVRDGIGSTNRMIDAAENARFYLDLVRTYAPAKEVVFAEALLPSARDRGLLADIGPYGSAAWWQFLFLSGVVVFTLGKRFGLPTVERRTQRGVRELLDALSLTMARGRQYGMALQLIAHDVDLRVRRLAGIDPTVPRADRNRLIPGDLANALADAEEPPDRVRRAEATHIARRLLICADEFETTVRGRGRPNLAG